MSLLVSICRNKIMIKRLKLGFQPRPCFLRLLMEDPTWALEPSPISTVEIMRLEIERNQEASFSLFQSLGRHFCETLLDYRFSVTLNEDIFNLITNMCSIDGFSKNICSFNP